MPRFIPPRLGRPLIARACAGLLACCGTTLAAYAQPGFTPDITLPDVLVTRDNTRIDRSCRVVIPEGLVIPDADGDGVIHILTPGITVEFAAGAPLRGTLVGDAPDHTPWDALAGVGIRVENAANVTIRGAHVGGYKVAILARNADGLTVEHADLRDNFRQRLGSTPWAEDARDWLWPHANDSREWATRYGAALLVERSRDVTIRRVVARRGQNGIMLDRVSHARIYDNDCSFLSGWGLAMWRTSDSVISRNAFDFCVRGHSEGVYNRGQDSAGILCFEQCSRNLFAENSATHGGDGFFGFAGKEALGETPPPSPDFDYAHAGCNDNEFRANDFSCAPAHGLELTFSESNIIRDNLFTENAICGIWGGYSSRTLIVNNSFARNGAMAYGLENGAINMEHASAVFITRNTFLNNRTGIHLWWDNDEALLKLPGVRAGSVDVTGNAIVDNTFTITPDHPFTQPRDATSPLVVLRLRDDPAADPPHVLGNCYAGNTVTLTAATAREFDVTPGREPEPRKFEPPVIPPPREGVLGETRPVGARGHLAGRRAIIMGPWGPWDHAEPMARLAKADGRTRTYEIFAGKWGGNAQVEDLRTGEITRWAVAPSADRPLQYVVSARQDVHPYAFRVSDGLGWSTDIRGVIVAATWDARFFAWTDATDPRTDLAAWRALAAGAPAVSLPDLTLRYAHAGPRTQPWAKAHADTFPGADRFGMIASARLAIPQGRWRITTLSDDGVRVLVGGRPVIENWTWHAPVRDTGVFEHAGGEVEIVVEHFEIDGYAVLEVEITPEP
ncbi:MAG: right-handed parallel beta-helix repeat-containing protein [Planctomycetota bacterium]|nr:right-handed parallel beta-helix repeat-containing protein [Planctomycetota bacterium]